MISTCRTDESSSRADFQEHYEVPNIVFCIAIKTQVTTWHNNRFHIHTYADMHTHNICDLTDVATLLCKLKYQK